MDVWSLLYDITKHFGLPFNIADKVLYYHEAVHHINHSAESPVSTLQLRDHSVPQREVRWSIKE